MTFVSGKYECGKSRRPMIREAIQIANTRYATAIDSIDGDCKKLATCLRGMTEREIEIQCGADCSQGASGESSAKEKRMKICGWGPGRTQEAVNQIVLHELIHLCGGTDLDCYALVIYAIWWDPSHPSNFIPPPPPSALIAEMCEASEWSPSGAFKYGTFIAWSPATGALYARNSAVSQWAIIANQGFIHANGGWQSLTCIP